MQEYGQVVFKINQVLKRKIQAKTKQKIKPKYIENSLVFIVIIKLREWI